MLVQLPHGLVDGQDLFDLAEIDELRGKQQNYLADKELVVGNIGHIPKILEDMILSLQTKEGIKWKGKISDAVWQLTSGDIETILVRIRENTYGPRFYHEADCSHCNHRNKNLRLDLDKLKLSKLEVNNILEPKVALMSSGTEVELKPMLLSDLFQVVKITTGKQNNLVTALVAVSLKRLGSKTPISEQDVENLTAKELLSINNTLENMKIDGSIDTNIDIECERCRREFSIKLNCFDPSFFAPTKGSTNLNT